MNSVQQLPAEIAESLGRGATVVTGNQRSARTLRYAFDLHNKQSGLRNWQSPQIFAWDAWTTMLWHGLLVDGHTSRLLLNQTQEHAVWHSILSADIELQSLRSKVTLATLAADAWQRLCAYQGQNKLRGAASSADTLAFERWAIEFHRRCRDRGLLARAELEDALTAAVTHNHLHLDQSEIVFSGFDRMNPTQAALIEALQSSGCKVRKVHQSLSAQMRILVRAADEEQEIRAAARWIRHFHAERPEARIAVVLPSLEEYRSRIDSIFREILTPEMQHIASPENACPYEFSLGIPLSQAPMVRTALDLLHLYLGPISIDQATALLLSPHFAMELPERGARAEFDVFEVRKALRLRPEVSLDWLSVAAYKSPRRQRLGELPDTLKAMASAVASFSHSQKQSHAEWAQVIRNLLATSRWGAGLEISVEFQVYRKWESALDELTSLDFDGSRVEFSQALLSLERITSQTVFAPESHEAPIQIMGAFEAAGSTFDAVWLMRAGDLSWPIPETSSPLLSWRLQRDLKMPGTDVTQDDLLGCKLTERIVSSAPTAIASYAEEAPEGQQLPSSSLEGLGLRETTSDEIAPPLPARDTVVLECLDDSEPIQPLPNAIIRGGSQILKHQSQCPFRAFAEHRLLAAEIERPASGMDAAESGIAVHRTLELFWNEVRTQQRLKQMTPDELSTTLDHCILRSLARMGSVSETSWDRAFMQMQRVRMNRLLMNWLELEMHRAPFEVMANEVIEDDVHVGPLRLNVRVDRIDSVEGGTILIDYKTGDVTPKAWLTERPDEPQLPLYATIAEELSLQGVAFGVVRAGENCDLTGFGATAGVLPHPRKLEAGSLEEQVAEWKDVLTKLAFDFSHGEARVDPKSYPETCKSCSQRILCRLDPSQLSGKERMDEGNNG